MLFSTCIHLNASAAAPSAASRLPAILSMWSLLGSPRRPLCDQRPAAPYIIWLQIELYKIRLAGSPSDRLFCSCTFRPQGGAVNDWEMCVVTKCF